MTEVTPLSSESVPVPLRVQDYLLLDQVGAFESYGKTELLDGVVLAVNAQFPEHYVIKSRLYRRLADACDALGRGVEAWTEGSIPIAPFNMPEPDLFVTSRTPTGKNTPLETILLVVEIASTSLDKDLGQKLRTYARAGIPEYWVADVNARVIHQMWAPAGEDYGERREVAFGEPIGAAAVDGLAVSTAGI